MHTAYILKNESSHLTQAVAQTEDSRSLIDNDEKLKFIYLSKIYGILSEVEVSKVLKKVTQQLI